MGGHRPSLRGPTAALALACLVWGLAPVALRFLARSSTPVDILIVRSALSCVTLLPFAVAQRPRGWTWSELGKAGMMGVLASIGYVAPVTIAAATVPASVASVLIATETVWIAFLGHVLLGELVPLRFWLALACGAFGVLFVSEPWHGGPVSSFGAALVLGGALAWAGFTIGMRGLSRRHGAFSATVVALFLGQAPYLIVLRGDHLANVLDGPSAVLAMTWLVIGSSLIATPLWNYGLVRIHPARGALFLYLIPVIGIASATLLLGESPSLTLAAGALLVIASVAASQHATEHRP